MSVIVPLIGNPCNQLLEVFPFVHARARDQCLSAIRWVFDATAEQENVPVMLNVFTLNGPALLEMVANIVRTENNALVILTGRAVDSGLAGFVYDSEPVTESDAVTRGELDCGGSEISSITLQSDFPSSNSATSQSADEELIELRRNTIKRVLQSRLDFRERPLGVQSQR